LIIGVSVAPQDVVGLLIAEADHVEVITSPSTYKFTTIECFYEEFRPITDQEVMKIVKVTDTRY
jgi:predicted phosphoribosyltransferase